VDIIRIILFALLINWCVSMQILNQNSNIKRIKIVSIILSLVFAATAAIVILLL